MSTNSEQGIGEFIAYLNEQFPATVGHLLIREKMEAIVHAALAPVMKENISLRLAIDDGILALHDKLEAERQKSADLSDALAFYADTHNYHDAQWSSGDASIQQDNGRCARDALGRKY